MRGIGLPDANAVKLLAECSVESVIANGGMRREGRFEGTTKPKYQEPKFFEFGGILAAGRAIWPDGYCNSMELAVHQIHELQGANEILSPAREYFDDL